MFCQFKPISTVVIVMLSFFLAFLSITPCSAFSLPSNENPSNSGSSFSLPAFQEARALEASQALDATRLHFQILFVDDDNEKGRIAEGLLAKVAEYNDAMFVLFPASATIQNARNAPRDAAAPEGALSVCASLGLCPSRSEQIGTGFDLAYLDDYDLIIAMDDEIRSLIVRSLRPQHQEYYAQKCRSLSEFLSLDFCGGVNKVNVKEGLDSLLDMLDERLRDRVTPFSDLVHRNGLHIDDWMGNAKVPSNPESVPRMVLDEKGAAVPNAAKGSWLMVESAMILASAGLTRFCLDTIDSQFDTAFQTLLDRNICRFEHLKLQWDVVDEQLRRCNASVCGYFSPNQRKAMYDKHCIELRKQLQQEQKP